MRYHCRYCGKPIETSYSFCNAACESAYERSIAKDKRHLIFFAVGLVLGFLILFYSLLIDDSTFTGISIIVMGATIFLFPFATPETIEWLGYRPSRILCRLLSFILIGVGIWVGWL